jgi:hypothetical protein
MPIRWTLYIDESGDFAAPDDPVSVAGLLLRGEAPAGLRAALEAAVPWYPWPLHASHLNQPA